MENASKALLMAAGILIGLLVLSLAVYLFVTFGASAREMEDEINSTQLAKFNANFDIYAYRNDITIYNIISLVNLAKENNSYYKDYPNYNTDYIISITLFDTSGGEVVGMYSNGSSYIDQFTKSKKQELIEKYNKVAADGKISDTFSCNDITYHPNGRISGMSFYK